MRAKRIGRTAGIAIVMLGAISANAGRDVDAAPALSNDTDTSQAAQVSLTSFLTTWRHAPGATGAAVRITRNDGQSVWLSPVGHYGDRLIGRVRVSTAGHPAGALVLYDPQEVQDWLFFDREGRMYGNFTARALLPTLPERDARLVRSVLSERPLPG